MWLTSPSGMPLKLPWMSISAGPHWRHSLPMPTSSFCLSCLNALVEPLRQSLNYGLLNCSQALSARRLWQMLVPVSPFQPAMWGILLTSVMRCLGASLSPNALRRSSGVEISLVTHSSHPCLSLSLSCWTLFLGLSCAAPLGLPSPSRLPVRVTYLLPSPPKSPPEGSRRRLGRSSGDQEEIGEEI